MQRASTTKTRPLSWLFFSFVGDIQILLLIGSLGCVLGGCGSVQYADVKRQISHEEYSRAQTALEAAGPVDAEGWALLAESRLCQKDYLGLAAAAQRSLAISGEFHVQIDHYLQQAFIEQVSAGIRAFDDGDDPEASRLFGQLLVYCQAIRERMTPAMTRTSQKAAALAGSVAIRLRDYPNAKSYLEGLRAEWKSNPALLERLAFIYYQMGEPQLCVATCESLLVKQPASLTVLQLRAQAYQQLGHADATVNAYRDALEEFADSPVLNRNLGIILFDLEDWKQARARLETAYRMRPADSLSLLVMIAECLYNEGNFDGALQRFKRALDAGGPNPDLLRAVAACYRNLGDRKQAAAAFREAERLTHSSTLGLASDSATTAPQQTNGEAGQRK